MTDWLDVRIGDNREVLDTLPDASVHCVVTSPPYWGLRDYGHGDQLGLEPTPEEYVANMVDVFRKVWRVLRDDGTLWLNLGDTFGPGKQLVGIPWRVAFALQADGWYLRSDIIWSKPNPMPESVTDRPTKAHEYLFLLSKSPRYYWDQEAVRESGTGRSAQNRAPVKGAGNDDPFFRTREGFEKVADKEWHARNIRTVWTIPTKPYPGAHFAVFPPELVEPCIKAGCPESGLVLDPFAGSGTVGLVANKLSRRAILIDLNPDYLEQIEERTSQVPLGLVG